MANETYEKKMPDRTPEDGPPHGPYPNQMIWQSPGGVRIAINNKEGKESLVLEHPSGNYMQIWPDGSETKMTIGESKNVNKSGVTMTVAHNGDVHFHGHQKVTMGGGAHMEVQGDAGVIVGGKTAFVALGDLGLSVNGNMLLTAKGNVNMNAMGDMNFQAKGSTYQGTGGTHTVQASQLQLNPSDGASGYTT